MSGERAAGPSNAFLIAHFVGCAVTWGSAFLFMKLINGELSPVVIATLRGTGAALALAAVLLVIRQSLLPSGREWKDWLVLGTVNGWAPNILVAYALTQLDSGPASLIQSSGPLMTVILAHFLLAGDRITPQRVVGIGTGFIGMMLLIGPNALQGGGTLMGILAMLLLTFGYATGNIYARFIPNPDPMRMAFGQQIVSAIAAAIIAFATVGWAGFAGMEKHAPSLVILSVFSTALPIWFFMRLITRAGATRASTVGYLIPTVAVLIGVVVLGEPIVPRQIIGGLIVFLGVAITSGLMKLPIGRAA